jgi:hypothetical protein
MKRKKKGKKSSRSKKKKKKKRVNPTNSAGSKIVSFGAECATTLVKG